MASPFVDWHSLLMVARGVISSGVPYQHLMQVANECDIPVVYSAERDLSRIPDGTSINLNSDTGEIHVRIERDNIN